MKCTTTFISGVEQSIPKPDFEPIFILVFCTERADQVQLIINQLKNSFPQATLLGCSTAGNISGADMREEGMAITFIRPEKGRIHAFYHPISAETSMESGRALAQEMLLYGALRHAYVLSEGLNVNGSDLAQGLRDALPKGVNVTGGLAGDGNNFEVTWVIDDSGEARSNICCALGFYGDEWQVRYGSRGGWNAFGLERKVTRSKGSVLFEIDGEPALELYKSYLGEKSKDLPASGLLFPLSMRLNAEDPPLVRTILSVSEKDQSLTFAGDIPEGAFVKLMKANFDRLIDGAGQAGELARWKDDETPDLTLLVSCVGRKLVLKQMVEEEIEAVMDVLRSPTVTGFYSYGELAPFMEGMACELHNQTMTVTTIREK